MPKAAANTIASVETVSVPRAVTNIALSGGVMLAPTWRRTVSGIRAARSLFFALADWWHESTDAIGSPTRKVQHPAYQRIIEAGDEMIPYILEDLSTRGGDWYAALREITHGANPVPAEHRGRAAEMTNDWLAWAEANGLRR